jgi:hypothetical protein
MQEADPFEGQCMHSDLVRIVLGALLAIEGARQGFIDGLCSPLGAGLPHEV